MVRRAFGELEEQILSLLQNSERATVRKVHKALGGHDTIPL